MHIYKEDNPLISCTHFLNFKEKSMIVNLYDIVNFWDSSLENVTFDFETLTVTQSRPGCLPLQKPILESQVLM